MTRESVDRTASVGKDVPGASGRAAAQELDRRRELALAQGGAQRVAAQHAKGRHTARERIGLLVEPGSFVELGQLAHSDQAGIGEGAPADALVTGVGLVDGRKVAVLAVDSTVLAGTTGWVGARKQAQLVHLAVRKGFPIVCLGDANGGRIPDLLGSGFAGIIGDHEGEDFLGYRHEVDRVPRVTAIMGNAYGDPALWSAVSDFVVMSQGSTVGLSGPSLVAASVGEELTHEQLAGPEVVARHTGLVSQVLDSEAACIAAIGRFLSYLPSNASLPPPRFAAVAPHTDPDRLADLVPAEMSRAYDMRRVIDAVADAGSFFELQPAYGRSLIAGLARIAGRPVGLLANQPMHQAGVFDAASLTKARKMVDLCDGFGLPLVFLQDLPGVMIGATAERTAVAVRLMDLYRCLAKATVPKLTVIVRKAFGFGWVVMGGAPMGIDYICAWPIAQIGFMAAGNAVQVLHRKQLDQVRQSQGDAAAQQMAERLEAELVRDNAPWTAAGRGYVHNVIKPQETRQALLDGLFLAEGYRPRNRRSC